MACFRKWTPETKQVDGFLPGTSVVGKSAAWFFNAASPGFQPRDGDGSEQRASAFLGGGIEAGVGVGAGDDASRDVRELGWRRSESGDMHVCLVSAFVVFAS